MQVYFSILLLTYKKQSFVKKTTASFIEGR